MSRQEHLVPVLDGWLLLVEDAPAGDPKGVVVLCHGLTGDRVGPQRLLLTLAEGLADAGYVCLRFDFRGSGDSSGRFFDTSFVEMDKDIDTVVSWAGERYHSLPLVVAGVSLGGVSAALAAERHGEAVVLVSSDLVEEIDFPRGEGGVVSIRDGQFLIDQYFFRERESLKPRTSLKAGGKPAVVFYGELDDEVVPWIPALRDAGIEAEGFTGAAHLFESVSSRHRLAERLVAWLDALLCA